MRRLAPAAALLLLLALPGVAYATPIPGGNWVWYYERVHASDAGKFAGARAVVVADQSDDAATTATIHSEGALAFHYVDMYWYPGNRQYEGVDIAAHPDWQFCRSPSQPLVGRIQDGVRWYYPDLNERGAYDAVVAYLRSLRARGYDGVFFDRATVALESGTMPRTTSACTADPVSPGASFAEAYARVVKDAASLGLHVALNYGATRPLRRDLSRVVDRLMQETPPHSRAGTTRLAADIARRRAEERAARGGPPRYVEEVKTTKPGDRKTAFYEWAEAALWRIDITVNAGDDGCPGASSSDICWHYGTFPELTAVTRGAPVDAQPIRRDCRAGDGVRCLWMRRWRDSVIVVNETADPVQTIVSTGLQACRVLTDVWSGRQLRGSACTTKASVRIPAYSGRVFTESR